jgi:hypothetical protein
MQRIRHGAETFGFASGETLDIRVSEPGECANLADFAHRTILACSLIGYQIVAEAPPRTLAGLDRAAWVSDAVRQFAGFALPPPAECGLFALIDETDRLELVIDAGQVFVAFCWYRDQDWLAWQRNRASQLGESA